MILKNSAKILVISVLVLFFSVSTIHATELQTWTLVSGGGTSSSDNYNVDLTIGNYVVGTTTSPSFILETGFLSIHKFNLIPTITDTDLGLNEILVEDGDDYSGDDYSGGGISGGSEISDDNNSDVKLYEISWDLCDSDIIRVLAGPASPDLGVQITTAQSGIVAVYLASEQPNEDILQFEANISQDESFVIVQAEYLVERSYQVDKQSVNLESCTGRVIVNEYTSTESDIVVEVLKIVHKPISEPEPEILVPAPFVDITIDPQYYIDRYYNEPNYKLWFDKNYPEYSSIYHAIGVDKKQQVAEPEPSESELLEITSQLILGIVITIAIIIISFFVYRKIVNRGT